MEQFCSGVGRQKRGKFLNENWAFSRNATYFVLVVEIYYKSHFDCKDYYSTVFFFPFSICSVPLDTSDGLFSLS